MIFLTGDVHGKIKQSWEQSVVSSNDLNSAKRYLEILKKYNIPCTLFINGICLKESPEKVKELLKFDVELGGHTYDNFGRMNIFKSYIYRKFFGCVYGPNFYKKKDIKKTREEFEKFGLKMSSWRTHCFASNEKTFEILKENNVKYVSDLLSSGNSLPFEKNEIIHMPINIPVDQNTIAFGALSPENRNAFASCTKGRIKAEEWFEILKKRIIENEKKDIPSIILIHPLTMEVLDNFKLFEKICKFLSKYKSEKISAFKLKCL